MKNRVIQYVFAAVLTIIALVSVQAAKPQANVISMTFAIATNCKVNIPGNPKASVADLKVGEKVGVKYTNNSGTLTAEHIHVMDAQKPPAQGQKPGVRPPSNAKPEGLHEHGVITSVNATTLVIESKVGKGGQQPPTAEVPAPK